MLAAGYGENHFCIPFHRVIQSKIRSRIAGMEGHDDIHIKRTVIAVDIAHLEPQTVVAVLLGSLITLFDDILFQIQANDLHSFFPDPGKIVIDDKSIKVK